MFFPNKPHMVMTVDSISDVLSLTMKRFRKTLPISAKIKARYILGIGQKDENFIIILDSEGILTADEFEIMSKYSEIG